MATRCPSSGHHALPQPMRATALAALLAVVSNSNAGQRDALAARTKGRPGAPVTVYEMSDFQCPYCRAFALATLPLLEREYVTTGKVRFVYINLPLPSLHANATPAPCCSRSATRRARITPGSRRACARTPPRPRSRPTPSEPGARER